MNLSLLETVKKPLQWTKDEECLYDLHTPLFFSAMTGATLLFLRFNSERDVCA